MSRSRKSPEFIPCVKPPEHGIDPLELARVAIEHNPANAPPAHAFAALGLPPLPQHIAIMTSKYWGAAPRTFGVTFLDTPDTTARRLILQHMNAWNRWCGASFAESASGEVRITRGEGGYWSYLGTDILSIPSGQATMCLQGFTANTPESEYKRVVRHETGHTLGCPHEHMRRQIIARIDRAKAIAYGGRAWGWSPQVVVEQVLTPVEEASLMGTPTAEDDSIMCYSFPGEITIDDRPIVGGTDITTSDGTFMGKIMPPPSAPNPPEPPPTKPDPGPPVNPGPAGGGDDDYTPERVARISADYIKATDQLRRQIRNQPARPGDFTDDQLVTVIDAYFRLTERFPGMASTSRAAISLFQSILS